MYHKLLNSYLKYKIYQLNNNLISLTFEKHLILSLGAKYRLLEKHSTWLRPKPLSINNWFQKALKEEREIKRDRRERDRERD